MEKRKFFKRTTLWMALLCLPLLMTGQAIEGNKNSGTLKVSGTSSLHDWEMELAKFEVSAEMEKDDDGSYTLKNASFLTEANHLISEKSMMERKAREALKSEKYPEIAFHQSRDNVTINRGNETFQIKGDLQIAGKTKPAEMSLKGMLNDDNQFQVKGKTSLKMTDFGIKPPTVMMGSIKTNDEVSVEFDISLTSKK